jgi:hypothetical protein
MTLNDLLQQPGFWFLAALIIIGGVIGLRRRK